MQNLLQECACIILSLLNEWFGLGEEPNFLPGRRYFSKSQCVKTQFFGEKICPHGTPQEKCMPIVIVVGRLVWAEGHTNFFLLVGRSFSKSKLTRNAIPLEGSACQFLSLQAVGIGLGVVPNFLLGSRNFSKSECAKTQFLGEKIRISKFSKKCPQGTLSGRCMLIFIVVGRSVWPGGCTKLFATQPNFFKVPMRKKRNFGGKKFEF